MRQYAMSDINISFPPRFAPNLFSHLPKIYDKILHFFISTLLKKVLKSIKFNKEETMKRTLKVAKGGGA